MWLYMYNLKKKLFLKCNVYNNKPRPNYLEFDIIACFTLYLYNLSASAYTCSLLKSAYMEQETGYERLRSLFRIR